MYFSVVTWMVLGVSAQRLGGRGGGRMRGRGNGGMPKANADVVDTMNGEDEETTVVMTGNGNGDSMSLIRNLIQNRDKINRDVTMTTDGVYTHTWSDDESVASWIEQHVADMKERMETGDRIRQRDPLFVAAFDHADLIDFEYTTDSEGGVYVSETSKSACGIDIVQDHAHVVSAFVEKGQEELRRDHDVPESCSN